MKIIIKLLVYNIFEKNFEMNNKEDSSYVQKSFKGVLWRKIIASSDYLSSLL